MTKQNKYEVTDSNMISELLLEAGLITSKQMSESVSANINSNEPVENTMLRLGVIKKKDIAAVLEKHYALPFADIAGVNNNIINIIPEKFLKKYRVIPVELNANILTLAMVSPGNVTAIDDIQMLTGYKIEPRVMLLSSFHEIMDRYYPADEVANIISEFEMPEGLDGKKTLPQEFPGTADIETPVIKLINTLITTGIKLRASDIHIEPQEKEIIVRYRIDGILRTVQILPKQIQLHVISRIKIMSDMNIAERRLPQDGQISIAFLNRNVDLRVSSLPGNYGEKLVLRILDKSSFILGFPQLGISPDIQSRIEQILQEPDGMIIMTGPTGSGKTTTLYAMINYLKSPSKNIITLEDPIEYELLAGKSREAGITQVQVKSSIGLTFAAGLRAALRQDPDVILVGEMRDTETAEIAMRSALTGHLVLTTLHTLNSFETITRLKDMGIELYLISSCIRCIIAQRLIRLLCPRCKVAYTPPLRLIERLGFTTDTLYKAKGCDYCGHSGYYGRAGIYELLAITDKIKDLIISNSPVSAIKEEAVKTGTRTLWEEAVTLVRDGKTSITEVMRAL
ncbi:GspE/PulE family protein [bacterium]|nr:GspE/PulE family protein [bacterium]